ncbi:MAG: YceI family protein [Ilumatobacteraceae bacterium]
MEPVMSLPLSPPGTWQIDSSHTQVGFSIRHLGISTVHGMFTEYAAQVLIGEDLESSGIEFTAATKSVDTGNAWRDEHLVGDLFFESDKFPEITFRSVSLESTGDTYQLVGDLTVKEVTKAITFDLAFQGSCVFPMDEKTHAGFQATATIRRSEFGVGYGVPVASDVVVIRIDAQLIAPFEEGADI